MAQKKTRENLPVSLTAVQTITDCNLTRIYESTIDRARYALKSKILVVFCLFGVKFFFIRKHQVGKRTINLMQYKMNTRQSYDLINLSEQLITLGQLQGYVPRSSFSTRYINIRRTYVVAANFLTWILLYIFSVTFDASAHLLFCHVQVN